MSETATAVAAPAGGEAKLDDLMLAMDVVDTLRHQEALVARELDEDSREAQLIERLREIYRSQGIVVTDAVLAEGVRSLKESRFVYTPPAPGLARTMAHLWVTRADWGRKVAVGLVAFVVAWGAWQYFFVGAAERSAERTRIELTQTLPAELEKAYQAVLTEARVTAARDRGSALLADGRTALERRDAAGARTAITALGRLLDQLRQEYTLRIVSRPNEQSGIWRVPPLGGRNYYVVVEAVSPSGRVLKLPVTSEEDQKTTEVERFGVRVPEQVFEAVRRDKADDGIIQRAVIGTKARGALEPSFNVAVGGGYITSGW